MPVLALILQSETAQRSKHFMQEALPNKALLEFGTFPPLVPQAADREACRPCWERLDRLDWPAGLAFESYGARIGIRVSAASALAQVESRLPPGARPAASPCVDSLYSLKVATPGPRPDVRRYHLLYQGIAQIARTKDLGEALAALEADLHGQVAARATERLFVHAGVVAWQGQVLLVPGRSFSGKSTLVAALVQAGAEYLSDEYAVFDAQGCVHPYPRRLSLRDAEGRPQMPVTVEALGGQTASGPLPVGLILSAPYEADARWRPRPQSPARALMALLDNTVQVRRSPAQALGILQAAALSAAAFKSKRGEAAQVLAWLNARTQPQAS